MFLGWKRQRKEEPEADPGTPLGCSPLDGVSVVALPPPGAATGTACSDGRAVMPQQATPSSSSSCSSMEAEAAALGVGASIELAARGEGCTGALHLPLECSSVRDRAAYFETLIRSNTTTHIQCSAEGVHYAYPSSGRTEIACASGSSSSDVVGTAAAGGRPVEFSEIHMVLRVPRPQPPPVGPPPPNGSARFGSVEEMEALIEQLQDALEVSEQRRKAAVAAYTRRTGECDNLMRVVRELTESRAKAASQRVSISEKYGELQAEYHRMLRIADLSRTVSKENLAHTSRARSDLRRVQMELHATKNHAQHMSEKHKKVRTENLLLKEKVQLLERLDFEEAQESEVKKHFTRFRLVETY